MLGPLPCVLEEVICHPRVTLRSQACFRDTWYYYNIKHSSWRLLLSSFLARFRVPGLIPCQLPVICKEKKKAARPVLRVLNPNLGFLFRSPPRLASAGRGESGDSQRMKRKRRSGAHHTDSILVRGMATSQGIGISAGVWNKRFTFPQ